MQYWFFLLWIAADRCVLVNPVVSSSVLENFFNTKMGNIKFQVVSTQPQIISFQNADLIKKIPRNALIAGHIVTFSKLDLEQTKPESTSTTTNLSSCSTAVGLCDNNSSTSTSSYFSYGIRLIRNPAKAQSFKKIEKYFKSQGQQSKLISYFCDQLIFVFFSDSEFVKKLLQMQSVLLNGCTLKFQSIDLQQIKHDFPQLDPANIQAEEQLQAKKWELMFKWESLCFWQTVQLGLPFSFSFFCEIIVE